MISVHQVSKSFGPVQALSGVSFEIAPGEVVGFLGPNGAGKTTLMRLLAGFFPPTQGTVLIDGQSLFGSPPAIRKRIGYLPEHNPLYRDMTTEEFLSYVASLKGIPLKDRKRATVEVVEQCGIESVWKRIIAKLSKGFHQRIGLAQALLGDPDFLILDEPTIGLDPQQMIEIRILIQNLGRRRTVLLASHILPEVQMTCGRILIINRGHLVASGRPDDLERQLRDSEELLVTVRGSWAGRDPLLANRLEGVVSATVEQHGAGERDYRIVYRRGTEVRSQIARLVVESGWELLSLRQAEWSLEEIFLKIVTSETEDVVECQK